MKKSSDLDLPPVLKRRVEGPVMTLANIQKDMFSRFTNRDQPPILARRSAEKCLSLQEIMDEIELLTTEKDAEEVKLEPEVLSRNFSHNSA